MGHPSQPCAPTPSRLTPGFCAIAGRGTRGAEQRNLNQRRASFRTMGMMRFSAVPTGVLGDRKASWAIYGDRIGDPDGLEASAFAGVNLAQIAPVPAAPMFNRDSLFGMHLAGIDLELDKDAPVVVFVHGFCYEPRRPVAARIRSDNAHRCLYHFSDTADGPGSSEERDLHITPWFARAMLEEGRGAPEECGGLAVGYS